MTVHQTVDEQDPSSVYLFCADAKTGAPTRCCLAWQVTDGAFMHFYCRRQVCISPVGQSLLRKQPCRSFNRSIAARSVDRPAGR